MFNKTTLIIFLLFTTFIGCSKKSADYITASYQPKRLQASDDKIKPIDNNIQSFQETTTHKLITNSDLKIRIENLDEGVDKLNELMQKYNTYASSKNVYENSRHYNLKVPADKYNLFLNELMKFGKITDYSETTEDVTMKYYDLESRLNTKKELIKTYQSYLSKAKNIEEILSVESKIAELQSEIDDVGGQFRVLNNLIDYATIRLEFLGPISITNYRKDTIINKIKKLMTGFGDYISAIIIILLAVIVYGIPAIVLLLLLYWILFGKIGLVKKVYKLVAEKK
jgi:predicted nuclease with TOPRIM domain